MMLILNPEMIVYSDVKLDHFDAFKGEIKMMVNILGALGDCN
jgi:hypothetical protein